MTKINSLQGQTYRQIDRQAKKQNARHNTQAVIQISIHKRKNEGRLYTERW